MGIRLASQNWLNLMLVKRRRSGSRPIRQRQQGRSRQLATFDRRTVYLAKVEQLGYFNNAWQITMRRHSRAGGLRRGRQKRRFGLPNKGKNLAQLNISNIFYHSVKR